MTLFYCRSALGNLSCAPQVLLPTGEYFGLIFTRNSFNFLDITNSVEFTVEHRYNDFPSKLVDIMY